MKRENLFRSFLMGGYECADHINRSGDRVDMLTITEHDIRVEGDYALLKDIGIKTVREGICWSMVEYSPGQYDFTEVRNRIEAADKYGLQQIWDMCHFGYPDDLSPTHPKFAARFAALCGEFVSFYRTISDAPLIIVPINEISFLSWHSGDMRGTVPFMVNSGWDIKYHLCKAAIQGIKAIKKADPTSRIMLIEPLINIISIPNEVDHSYINRMNEDQYQAMDIIGGRLCPELGGEESYLDILGFNYYYNNQWEHGGRVLVWPYHLDESTPLSILLNQAWKRYGKPMVLAETGHFGGGRAEWFDHIIEECDKAIALGIDLQGICLYPLISRPDWDDLSWYHDSGLWDISVASKERMVYLPLYEAILQYTQEKEPAFGIALQSSENFSKQV